VDKAFPVKKSKGWPRGSFERFLVPLEVLLPEYPKAIISEEGCRHLQKGRPLPDESVLEVIPAIRVKPREEPSQAAACSARRGAAGLAKPVEGGKAFCSSRSLGH